MKTAANWVDNTFLFTDTAAVDRFEAKMIRKFMSLGVRNYDYDGIRKFVERGLSKIQKKNNRPGISKLCTVRALEEAIEYYITADVPGSP